MQSDPAHYIGTGEAAKLLNVTTQTVRDWVRGDKLRAFRTPSGRFRIDVASVEALLEPDRNGPTSGEVEHTLSEITGALADLQARDRAAEQLLEAVERERDRFRAESATLRGAALQLAAAARETDEGVRHLLEVLERQRDALVQLLAPASPQDLIP